MNKQSSLIINALLKRYNDTDSKLLRFLSPDEQSFIEKLPFPECLPDKAFWNPERFLQFFHYSWIVPILLKYPVELHATICDSISSSQQSSSEQLGLAKLLSLPLNTHVQPPFVKSFFQYKIASDLLESEILPPEMLPESFFNNFLSLTKHQIVRLTDLLGLHDLALEIRHVLAKEVLEKIASFLSPSDRQYLRYCLRLSDTPVSPPIEIQKWISSRQKFNAMRQAKGLYRLAVSLFLQSKSLIWYIVHRLDTGRGGRLQSLLQSPYVVNLKEQKRQICIDQTRSLLQLFLQQDQKKV